MKIRTVLGILALTTGLSVMTPAFADDTLDRGIGSEWSSLDPQVNFDAAAGWIQMDAYEGLVNFDGAGQDYSRCGRKLGHQRRRADLYLPPARRAEMVEWRPADGAGVSSTGCCGR